MAVVLTACPFTGAGRLTTPALELRRGIVERVFGADGDRLATWSLESDPEDPLRLTLSIFDGLMRRTTLSHPSLLVARPIAAGGRMRELPSAETPRTLGESIDQLTRGPELARIRCVATGQRALRSPGCRAAPGARRRRPASLRWRETFSHGVGRSGL